MNWNFIPARGAIGGVLVGFKNYLFDIVSWQHFQLCDVTIVRNQIDNLSWRLIVVYGSPYEDEKLEFINELHMVMPTWVGPTLLGGGGGLTWLGIKREKVMVISISAMLLLLMGG
jgi:hypothetical protein